MRVDIDQLEKDWHDTGGPYHLQNTAEHFKVFEHLFGAAYFVPRVPLNIRFGGSIGETEVPVYCGNLLKPKDAQQPPTVTYDPSFSMTNERVDGSKTLWTLLMTNPDGNFEKPEGEYVHWLM